MRVAVLSLTRDRLDYTKHCFASLRENAGCDFDHYVLDNGSTDGTEEWLQDDYQPYVGCLAGENLGIHKGINVLLGAIFNGDLRAEYDVIVNYDNDCEMTVPGTLLAVAEIHHYWPDTIVGPVVNGLRHPMPLTDHRDFSHATPDRDFSYRTRQTPMVGGILTPIPTGFRYPEHAGPPNGDSLVSAQAAWCGQLIDYPVNHYRTTDGQHVDYPEYFVRRVAEGTPD